MSWFRTDDTMMDDAKIESLTSGQFRLWMRLLCAANQSNKPGIIGPLPWRGLYAKMHTGPKTFAKASALMSAMNMIEVDVLEDEGAGEMVKVTVVHFAKRQYLKEGDDPEDGGSHKRTGASVPPVNGHRKPSDDPTRVKERVARHRDRLDVNELGQEQAVHAPASTPPVVTPQNGDVTPPVTPPASRAPAPAPATQAEAEAESFVFTKAEAEAPLTPHEEAVVSVSASAPPLEDKSSPAHAPPLPPPIRLAGESPPLLSKYDEKELLKSGWSLTEIDIGVEILQERKEQGKRVESARSLLHKSILPDVRDGKRPKGKAPPDTQEKITYVVNGGLTSPSGLEEPCQHPPDMSVLRQRLHTPGQPSEPDGQNGHRAG